MSRSTSEWRGAGPERKDTILTTLYRHGSAYQPRSRRNIKEYKLRYRLIDWWTDHFRFEVRKVYGSREERTVLSISYIKRMPPKSQRRLNQYLRC